MESLFCVDHSMECLPLHDDTPMSMEPIHRAICRGNLNLVKSYVERGASVETRDEMGNTCLIVACKKGESDIVKYLLNEGVDVNARNRVHESALHRCLFVQDVQLLLTFNAKMFKNKYGFSPLKTAALDGKHGVVESLLKQPNISLSDKIDALELLGASHRMSWQKVIDYWKRAAVLRTGSPSKKIIKKPQQAIAAFSFEQEFQTVQDLEDIVASSFYQEKIRMQCILIYKRLLGTAHIFTSAKIYEEVKRNVTSRTINERLALLLFLMEEESKCFRYSALMQYDALWVLLDYLLDTTGETILIDLVLNIYSVAVQRFEIFAKEKVVGPILHADMEQQNRSIELLLDVLRWLVQNIEPDRERELAKRTKSLLQLELSGRHGKSVIQLAIRNASPPSYRRCQMPSWKSWNACIAYLVKCGADPNSIDMDGNNALHTLMNFLHLIRHKHQLKSTFQLLLDYGCHLDAVNYNGRTCMYIALKKGVALEVEYIRYTTLQCLACKAIKSYGLQGCDILPRSLEKMIAMH